MFVILFITLEQLVPQFLIYISVMSFDVFGGTEAFLCNRLTLRTLKLE